MSALYLYDDARARRFQPFALTRPVGELRAGAALLRDRWERALGLPAAGSITAPHLAGFEEVGAPPVMEDTLPAGSVIANARCVVPLGWSSRSADVWSCAGRVAAVRAPHAVPLAELDEGRTPLEALATSGTRVTEVPGRWVAEVWELITGLAGQLTEDIAALGPVLAPSGATGSIVIGGHPVYIEEGATIEPQVVFDVSSGPVLVRREAVVRAFTRLAGPCYVGRGVRIVGDRVSGCSIGDGSVIRGEISETVVLGQSNKGHDGFVGHSYLGRWVNLGAGTITSNLKNTYASVALWTPEGTRDTGTTKLGSLIGDHVKTGIGLRLTTGTVLGAGSNLFGSRMPGKYVPPFSWGEGDALDEYRLDRFLVTAERAMERRQVVLGAGPRRMLSAAHALARDAEGTR